MQRAKTGFTLIELLIVMAVLAALATIVLILINPIEQLSKARDSGRISAVTQMGRAVVTYYVDQGETYPAEDTWDQDLVQSGKIATFPSGIEYFSNNNVTLCDTNVKPDVLGTYCYAVDTSLNQYGAIVFAKLESQTQRVKCSLVGDTYFVYSTADGMGGVICSNGDPVPWEAGSVSYLE